MYSFIKGKVDEIGIGKLVIECNDIGYEVTVPERISATLKVGDIVKIYTYLYVKEDRQELFGFLTSEEKIFFNQLININGVGPKSAIQILGTHDLATLRTAIATQDVKTLTQVKGLGKKTAEMIIVNMKGNVDLKLQSDKIPPSLETNDEQDAVNTLEALGVNRSEAIRVVALVAKEVTGVENIIRAALQQV